MSALSLRVVGRNFRIADQPGVSPRGIKPAGLSENDLLRSQEVRLLVMMLAGL
jgi:hypothetical protein